MGPMAHPKNKKPQGGLNGLRPLGGTVPRLEAITRHQPPMCPPAASEPFAGRAFCRNVPRDGNPPRAAPDASRRPSALDLYRQVPADHARIGAPPAPFKRKPET